MLIQTKTRTYISVPLNSELFCSFSWDSVKSSALFASFFWKSFSESLFFFEGLPLAGPVLSLGKTPGIFPGGQVSGGGGRPGREAAFAAHAWRTDRHGHASPLAASAGSSNGRWSRVRPRSPPPRALAAASSPRPSPPAPPAPRAPRPARGTLPRAARPHGPARPGGRSPAGGDGAAGRARPGPRERAQGPREQIAAAAEPPLLTATSWHGAGRRRRPPVAMETVGRPGAALPTTGNLARFPRRQDPRPHPSSRPGARSRPLKRRSGSRRQRPPGPKCHSNGWRSVSRQFVATERHLHVGPPAAPPPRLRRRRQAIAAGSPRGPAWARAGASNRLAKGLGLARGEGRRLG